MKKLTFVLLLSAIGFQSLGQGVKTPAPSPAQTIKQDFGLSAVEVNYSRPAAKGRKIFGDIVPFGKLWRTGANSPTKITFGEDVKIAGKDLKADTYQVMSIPAQGSWEILFNKGKDGVFNYHPEEDVLKVSVPSQVVAATTENFTIQFANISANKMDMVMVWENTRVSIPVEVDIDSKIMSSIDRAMNIDSKPYFEAASYYFETGRDLNKALEWVNKATAANPNAYWQFHLKAKIQAKLGDKAGAKATAMKSIELAKAGKNEDYVALNEKLIKSL